MAIISDCRLIADIHNLKELHNALTILNCFVIGIFGLALLIFVLNCYRQVIKVLDFILHKDGRMFSKLQMLKHTDFSIQ